MSTMPVTFDDGTSAMVPQEKVAAALKDGGKLAQHMQFDDGTQALVPLERVHDAMKDGGRIIGESPSFPKGATPNTLKPSDFMGRIGDRIESNFSAIPQAIDEATGAARADLKSPKAQAEYDAELKSKAAASRRMVFGDATSTAGKVANAALIAPRTAWSMAKEYWHDPATAIGDLVTASPELAEAKLPANSARRPAIAPPPTAEAALAPEQQSAYTAALDKANADYATQTGRKQALAQQQQALVSSIHQGAQQLYKSTRAGLDTRWNALRDTVGAEAPTPIRGITDAINTAIKEDLRGSPGTTKQFKELMGTLGMQDMIDDAGGLTATPDATAPWQTLRVHSASLGRALSSGDLPGNIYQALKKVHAATEDALGQTAEARGVGPEYKSLKTIERQFRQDFEDLGPVSLGRGTPAARLVRAPSATFATNHVLGKGSDILEKTLDRWDQTGELADAVRQARETAAAAKEAPKPTLAKVKVPPPPETPKAGPVLRHAARIGGKLVGGALGSAVGHPLVGYGVGSEVGSEIADRIAARRRVVPPPPSQ